MEDLPGGGVGVSEQRPALPSAGEAGGRLGSSAAELVLPPALPVADSQRGRPPGDRLLPSRWLVALGTQAALRRSVGRRKAARPGSGRPLRPRMVLNGGGGRAGPLRTFQPQIPWDSVRPVPSEGAGVPWSCVGRKADFSSPCLFPSFIQGRHWVPSRQG